MVYQNTVDIQLLMVQCYQNAVDFKQLQSMH